MSGGRVRQPSEFVVVALLAALSGLVLWDTLTADTEVLARGPVGARTMPLLVAGLLATCAVVLAIDLLRGGRGVPDEGEPNEPSDWRTWSILVAAIVLTSLTIDVAGWVIAGGLMYYLCTLALGSRHYVRDLLVASALSVSSFYLFYSGLGVALPAGYLQGVL